MLHLEEVLYVPGLKKNLISVAVLESKGYIVLFMEGKAFMWAKDEDTQFNIGNCNPGRRTL